VGRPENDKKIQRGSGTNVFRLCHHLFIIHSFIVRRLKIIFIFAQEGERRTAILLDEDEKDTNRHHHYGHDGLLGAAVTRHSQQLR